MATEQHQDIIEERSDNKEPADAGLFTGQVNEELSERDIFAGDEDFYKSLVSRSDTEAHHTKSSRTKRGPALPQKADIQNRFYSILQKTLAVCITVIVVILLYAVLEPFIVNATNRPPSPPAPHVRSPQPPIKVSTKTEPEQTQKKEPAYSSTESLSLKVAQNLYLQADYENAYTAYDQLCKKLPGGPEEELMKDFLRLRMALCMKALSSTKINFSQTKNTNVSDQVDRLFRPLLNSRSPVVRMLANYYMAFNELQKKQYLKAQTRAYQTIALIDTMDFDKTWGSSLRPDCHFLVAESMTRHILSLCDADKDFPNQLWSRAIEIEPFTNLNEQQLRLLLNSGIEPLNKSLLSPKIQKLNHQGISSRWSIVCHGAPIEELLARFASNAGLNITWNFSKTPESQVKNDAVRKRLASIYLSNATKQQFIKVAAGHVGLLALQNSPGVIDIYNPADYSSLSEHIALLTREAISLWQRFLSVFHNDQRIPNAHFALALLQARRGQITDATAEYKLVANRYAHSSVAPLALLNSGKLKTDLHDFAGARQDLKQLVEQYPDNELSSRACLYLADATMKAGLPHEAGRLYSKVYHLGLSLESQIASAFGAGKCFYEQKEYQESAKWLTRYINIAKDRTSRNLYYACFLLGKSYLALEEIQQACDAFEAALGGSENLLTSKEYIQAVSALVEAKILQGNFIEALTVLDNTHSRQFSAEESTEILLLNSRVLRTIGLVDEAIAAIGDRAKYTLDPHAKARISLELARCYIAQETLEPARKELTDILTFVEPGPLSHEIALELAKVCLKLGQSSQTISICSQLLDLEPSPQIKQKALNILAAAYNRQKNYDKAALVLLGKWNVAKETQEKLTPNSPAATDQSPPQTKQNPL
jgi:TolA-binding protein